MGKDLEIIKDVKIERPVRVKLSPEESRRRMEEFEQRKEKFVAAIREGKD